VLVALVGVALAAYVAKYKLPKRLHLATFGVIAVGCLMILAAK
jgi:hypothetical protein